jgi:hypothetical protein
MSQRSAISIALFSPKLRVALTLGVAVFYFFRHRGRNIDPAGTGGRGENFGVRGTPPPCLR